jgi:iron complex outermembrane recepter protein
MKKIVLLLFIGHFVFAQNITLKGKVSTSHGQAAEFVNVVIKGLAKGTVADENGRYVFNDLKAGTYTVQASYVGLKAQNKQVVLKENESAVLNFELEVDANELMEVVVLANPSKYVTDYPSVSLRLKTPLLEVPQNIQVITKQVLQDQQIFDMLEGVTRNVSGASRVEHWDNYAQINMRGSQIAGFRNGMNVQST